MGDKDEPANEHVISWPGAPGRRARFTPEQGEISRYGTLRTWAEELGFDDAGPLLQATLDEEKTTDQTLTKIAESAINQDAEAA